MVKSLNNKLQQYLPFTVLKLTESAVGTSNIKDNVATVLTVYGIETSNRNSA